MVGPELGDVPFEVVWALFWISSFPDVVMTLDVAEAVEAGDVEEDLWNAVEARSGQI